MQKAAVFTGAFAFTQVGTAFTNYAFDRTSSSNINKLVDFIPALSDNNIRDNILSSEPLHLLSALYLSLICALFFIPIIMNIYR